MTLEQWHQWIRQRLRALRQTNFIADWRSGDPSILSDGGRDIQTEPSTADAQNGEEEIDFDDEKLLNGIGLPLFMLDRNSTVIAWNERIEQLTGVSNDEVTDAESVVNSLYPEAERTLAEQVLTAPEHAHEKEAVQLVDQSLQIYERERSVLDSNGDEHHYECAARPLYQDGELAAVLQTVQERTEAVRRHDTITGLVEELRSTFTAIADGNLGARATFHDRNDSVDETLFAVIDDVNAMAEELESLATRVEEQTGVLAQLGDRSMKTATEIDTHVTGQRAVLDDVSEELEQFSANMEEVAASSDQIATSADESQRAAKEGLKAGEQARQATDSVLTDSKELVETVQALEAGVDDIETVLAVIDEVAEQTNLLALNASIESARAGQAGDGFGVVADEIKELAAKTREHTEAIDESVTEIQSQAQRATSAVEKSHAQVEQTGDEIDDVLSSLDEIVTAAEETATGIQEVANANEQQATTVQEVLSMVDDVRDHADNVEQSTAEIGDVIDKQQQEIAELEARVASLSRSKKQ